MSSAKRRKVDGDVPSSLLKKMKHVAKDRSPTGSASTSPEPAGLDQAAEKAEEEVTKTFKDLVRAINLEYSS